MNILKLNLRINRDSYVDVRFSSLCFSLLSRLFIILAVECRLSPAPITPRAQGQSGPRSCPCHHSLHEGIRSTPPMPHTIHNTHTTFFYCYFFCSLTITTTLLQFISESFSLHYNHTQFVASARNVSATGAAINL